MIRVIRVVIAFWAAASLQLVFISVGQQWTSAAENTEKAEQRAYIPKDLNDCFAELEKILKPDQVQKMRQGTESEMIRYHRGLGTWLRNNWGLWHGSRLTIWFNQKGIHHPDDMSGIILTSFWRRLNSKPIALEEQVKHYQDYWQKTKKEAEREKDCHHE